VATCLPLVGVVGVLATSCGGASTLSSLTVATQVIDPGGTSSASAPVAQGTAAQIQITVTNVGSSSIRGVTIRVAVPAGLVYSSTASLVENGDAVRSADVAPTSRAATLTWGSWTIGPGAPGQPSQVVILANLQVTGAAASVQVAPQVFASGYTTSLQGRAATVQITAAPSLSLVLRASPASVTAGSFVVYHAVITNTGSGPASAATLSITLPSDFDYELTQSTAGNASTAGAGYPVVGSVIPTWSGFDIPGQSSSGPGILTLTFEVKVLPDVPRGVYQATAGLVASNGSPTENELQLNYGALAPVTVLGPQPG